MYEQIYNLTSMFFKSLKGNLMYEFLISKFNGKRGPKRQLSLEQIVALNIYRFHFKTGDLKNYHKMIRELMRDKVPNLPNYENFMKATNKSTVFILHLKQLQMFQPFFYSIAAYMINRKLDFYQNFFRLRLI